MEEADLMRESSLSTPNVMKYLKEVLHKEILHKIYLGKKLKDGMEAAKVLKKFGSLEKMSSSEPRQVKNNKKADEKATRLKI